MPPPRDPIDGNVDTFEALNAMAVLVLGKDGNLWLESAPFGRVPPERKQVDRNVESFKAIDADHVAVLDTSGSLWLEDAVARAGRRERRAVILARLASRANRCRKRGR